MRKRPILNR